MRTDYVVTVVDHNTQEVLTILDVREEGARGRDGKPENVALLCRPPMLRAKPAPVADLLKAEHERFERWARRGQLCERPLTRDVGDGHYIDREVRESWRTWVAATEVAYPGVRIDMILFCPACGMQHIDAPESENTYSGDNPPHRSHLCANCGHQWRPADVATNGVAEIKTRGKNDSPPGVSMVMKPPIERKTEAGGLVLNSDGLPRLYSVSFRPEGGFLVEPVVPTAAEVVVDEKAAAAAERIGDALRRAPGEPARDTEVEMARRQAVRLWGVDRMSQTQQQAERADFVKNASADEMAARAKRVMWTASFDLHHRNVVVERLREVLAFPRGLGHALGLADVGALHAAVSFLESLAP